jgi:HAD superfamily hydrolase (TIGR01509 family)
MSDVQCVIFDCEGTLIDSEPLTCEALVSVFAQYGATLTMDECFAHFYGGKLTDILASTRNRLGLSVSTDELEPKFRETLNALYEEKLKPMDGVIEILEQLKARDIPVAVASNGPLEKIEHSLTKAGLYQYFEGAVFSGFEANSWKPEPDLIQLAAMHMGFAANQCLYVDDTPKGVEAGMSAGATTVHFRSNPMTPKSGFLDVTEMQSMKQLNELLTDATV